MGRNRCQVCDGEIKNGRCILCGMPYRQADELTYHLNENQREHYKHATPEARKIMRESQIPLGDKNKSASAVKKASSTTKNAEIKINKSYTKPAAAKKNVKKNEKNSGKGRMIFYILMIFIIIDSLGSCLSI